MDFRSFLKGESMEVNPSAAPVASTGAPTVAPAAPAASREGAVDPDTPEMSGVSYDYDLLVIGGGSGGLAASKRASELGARTALCDFVQASPQGTTWGLGGTCVNVGCIPKKLMHTAALHGEAIRHAAPSFGWKVGGSSSGEASAQHGGASALGRPEGEEPASDGPHCDWMTLRDNVDGHIRSLNFGYGVDLRKKGVKYFNAYATFVDAHTCELKTKKGDVTRVTARRILLATGGRPTLPDIPGAQEYGVSSDDIFKMKRDPGRTLVVGASYVALECAGFLNGIGRPTTVMMRSIPLRGFDQDMAGRIVTHMEAAGASFIRECVPTSVTKLESGALRVTWANAKTNAEAGSGEYDTVLFAIGRTPETSRINLAATGVALTASGHVVVDGFERTSVPHIYAIGDIIKGGLELTPVAIKAGRLLADRLFGQGTQKMDYNTVPTTVFTPLEYGCVGLSEEKAEERYGVIEVYHTSFTPLEWTVPHLGDNVCYMKLIVNPIDSERVLGFHILSPNAGEITQGVAVALKCGATKQQFDDTIGIHPTIAEDFTLLKITKSSGESATKSGC